MNRVFVYGTLLRGFGNNSLLRGSILIGEAKTLPEFHMVSLGHFPGIVRGGSTVVVGEVYEVGHATLAQLDRLEGHPRFYERQEIELFDGGKAYAYVLPDSYLMSHARILSGSWCIVQRERECAMHEDACDMGNDDDDEEDDEGDCIGQAHQPEREDGP